MNKVIVPLLFTLVAFQFLYSSDDELNPELAPLMMPPEIESMEYTMDMLEQWESVYHHLCSNEMHPNSGLDEAPVCKTVPC